jgi:alpha-tubulin suppressor-like RCC1 family protein
VSCSDGSLAIPETVIPDLPPVVGLVAGRFHTCAVGDESDLYCWGANHDGKVGDGTFVDRATPQLILSFA